MAALSQHPSCKKRSGSKVAAPIVFHHEVRQDLAKMPPSLAASLLKAISGWSVRGLPRSAYIWGPSEEHQFFHISGYLAVCHVRRDQVIVLSLQSAEESFSAVKKQNPPTGGF